MPFHVLGRVQGFEERAAKLESDIADSHKRAELEGKVGAHFDKEERYQQLSRRQSEIEEKLDLTKNQAPSQVEVDSPDGNAQDRVLILGWSEFGRRVAENKGGTDHGTAGLSFCVGKAVRGGFYGDYPDLSSLDKNGNMKFTVDFRSLYASVLDKWLGQDPAATDLMLGAAYPRLGLL